jgi:hypothetical protein
MSIKSNPELSIILSYFAFLRYEKHYWDAIQRFVTTKDIIQFMLGVREGGGGGPKAAVINIYKNNNYSTVKEVSCVTLTTEHRTMKFLWLL